MEFPLDSMSKAKPYVGITGITTQEELDKTLAIADGAGFGPSKDHNVMVGFLATTETVNGVRCRSPRHVANVRVLAALMKVTAERAFAVIHFETDGPTFAPPLSHLLLHIADLPTNAGVQINGTSTPADVRRLRDDYPHVTLINQLRPELLRQGDDAVLAAIAAYRGEFAHVLIDPSCGLGIDLDVSRATKLACAIVARFPDVTVGFAGGFSGTNAEQRVRAITAGFGSTEYCIDVEGKVRDKKDLLSIDLVRGYFEAAARGFFL